MYHIADVKKYLKCPVLFYRSINNRNEEYKPYVRLDEALTLLACKKLGLSEYFLGQKNDDKSLALCALKNYEWLVKARFEYHNLRIKIPFLHKTNYGYDVYFVYCGNYCKDDDMQFYIQSIWVLKNNGIFINNIYIMHFNANYVRQDSLDPNELFIISDSFYNDSNMPTKNIKDTIYAKMRDYSDVIDEMEAFEKKAEEFKDVLKMGRTQLQDAVPMTLGQEFHGYASTLRESLEIIKTAAEAFKIQNLGGTAIGTGAAAHPQFPEEACKALCEVTGFDMKIAPDMISASSNTYGMLNFHAALKVSAARLSQICNDLRLMGSGPRCGLHEINLPPRAPGSSIMPGKVNPVIPEVVNQTCFQIIGADTACTMASEAGQLELNVMEPVIIYNVFNSIHMFTRAMRTLRELCIETVTANPEHTANMVHNSIGIVTCLLPFIGYKNCTKAAKKALETGKSVKDVLVELGLCTEEEVNKYLVPEEMIHPEYISKN